MEMNCRQVQDLMLVSSGTELQVGNVPGLKSHIAGCPRCAAELVAWQAVNTDLVKGAEFTPNAAFFAGWDLKLEKSRLEPEPIFSTLIRKLDWLMTPQRVYGVTGIAAALVLAFTGMINTDIFEKEAQTSGLANRLVMPHGYIAVVESQDSGIRMLNANYAYEFANNNQQTEKTGN
ncbi:hypothetical protein ACFLQV_02710 [Calditrichota bacterium]